MNRRAAALGLLVAAILGTASAHADVYVLEQSDGTLRFSNTPDDPAYRIFLREGGAPAPAPAGQYENALLTSKPYHAYVIEAAKTYRLDPALLHAVITAESNYNQRAVSKKGAIGLMQIMPDTGRRYGAKVHELAQPALNINVGARYLADLMRRFDGNLQLALAGYNAGEQVVLRYGNRIPPYPETQAYVPRVLQHYSRLKQ